VLMCTTVLYIQLVYFAKIASKIDYNMARNYCKIAVHTCCMSFS